MTTRRWSVFVVVVVFSLMLGDRVKATTSISSSSPNNNKTDLERLLDAAQLKKASLAIVIPWTGGNDAGVDGEVLKMVDFWGEFEACRKDEISVVAKRGGVSLVFLSSLATKENMKSQLELSLSRNQISECFVRIQFISLYAESSSQRFDNKLRNSLFLRMFQLPEMAEYDYAFWMETATSVKRKHWIDAMHEEVRREEVYRIPRRGFWMKGSIDYCAPPPPYREEYISAREVAMEGSSFVNLRDGDFLAFLRTINYHSEGEGRPWQQLVMQARDFPIHDRQIRHMFVPTPFLMRCSSFVSDDLVRLKKNTYLWQGIWYGQMGITNENLKLYSPPPTTPPRLLLIMPFPPTPKHLKVVLFHISLWKRDALFPCRESSLYSPYVSLFFSSAFASKGWSHYEDIQKEIEEAVDATGARGCFKEIGFRSRYGDADYYEKTQFGGWNVSVNIEFWKTLKDDSLREKFDYFFWLDPDAFPIQRGFMDIMYEEVLLHPSYGFFCKGSAHWAPSRDPVEGQIINGNAYYSLQDKLFLTFIGNIMHEISEDKRKGLTFWFFDGWLLHMRNQNARWMYIGKYIFPYFHFVSSIVHYESYYTRKRYFDNSDSFFPSPTTLQHTALMHGAWLPSLWTGEPTDDMRKFVNPHIVYLTPLNVLKDRSFLSMQREERTEYDQERCSVAGDGESNQQQSCSAGAQKEKEQEEDSNDDQQPPHLRNLPQHLVDFIQKHQKK